MKDDLFFALVILAFGFQFLYFGYGFWLFNRIAICICMFTSGYCWREFREGKGK